MKENPNWPLIQDARLYDHFTLIASLAMLARRGIYIFAFTAMLNTAAFPDTIQDCRRGDGSEQSIRACAVLIKKESKNPVWLHFRGSNYSRKKLFDLAMQDFNNVLTLDPVAVETIFEIGFLLFSKKEFIASTAYFNKAISIGIKKDSKYSYDPVTQESIPVFCYAFLASAYIGAKEYSKALDVFSAAIIYIPAEAVWAHKERAVIFEKLEKRDQAIHELRKALALAPGDQTVRNEIKRLGGE